MSGPELIGLTLAAKEVEWLEGQLYEMRAERDRYREALEWIADAERVKDAIAYDWAVEAHRRAREALADA